jgi:hypothetical protein
VATEDNKGKTKLITTKIFSSWNSHWVSVNAEIEAIVAADPILSVFDEKMFHVWDGDHKVQAWMPIIDQDHRDDLEWHYFVDNGHK